MGGTSRPNGSPNGYNVTSQSSAYVKAPVTPAKSAKPQSVRGGDLRAKGSK